MNSTKKILSLFLALVIFLGSLSSVNAQVGSAALINEGVKNFFAGVADQFRAVGVIVRVLVTGERNLNAVPENLPIKRVGDSPVVEVYRIGDPKPVFPDGEWGGGIENRAPQFLSLSDKIAKEGIPLKFQVLAADPEGDALLYTLSPIPRGAVFNERTGIFEWTPDDSQLGVHRFTFSAIDKKGKSANKIITLTVGTYEEDEGLAELIDDDEISDFKPPRFESIGSHTVGVGDELIIDLAEYVSDPNGIKYSIVNVPDGAVFNSSTGRFTWRPTSSQAGKKIITFRVTNSSGQGEAQSVEIIIEKDLQIAEAPETEFIEEESEVNYSPEDDTQSENIPDPPIQENRPPVIASLRNISIPTGIYLEFDVNADDPDGDHVLVSLTPASKPVGATFEEGTFSWSPNSSQAGDYTLVFTASDGELDDEERVTISVTEVTISDPQNRPPVFSSVPSRQVNEGNNISFVVSANDPDGDELTISSVGLPLGATFSSGLFSWTPSYTQSGTHSITFLAGDGELTVSTSTVITVINVNRAPIIISPGNKSVNENQALSFTLQASDPDGDNLQYSLVSPPSGAVTNSSGAFSWTPSYSQAGTYQTQLRVSDSALSSNVQITVTVLNINRVPTFTAVSPKTVAENIQLQFTVNASDPDGEALTYSYQSPLPTGATAAPITGGEQFTWRPSYSQAGNYSVVFRASDGITTSSLSVPITVTNVNRPPSFSTPNSYSVEVSKLLTFIVTALDPDGDAITYGAQKLPVGAQFNTSTHTFDWAPSTVGTYSVDFRATDALGLATTHSVTITVTSAPQGGGASSLFWVVSKVFDSVFEDLYSTFINK